MCFCSQSGADKSTRNQLTSRIGDAVGLGSPLFSTKEQSRAELESPHDVRGWRALGGPACPVHFDVCGSCMEARALQHAIATPRPPQLLVWAISVASRGRIRPTTGTSRAYDDPENSRLVRLSGELPVTVADIVGLLKIKSSTARSNCCPESRLLSFGNCRPRMEGARSRERVESKQQTD